MKRGRIRHVENCCFHITHRCQERRFLLRFERDRRNFVQRLMEATAKYPADVLDYVVTSNHIYLLLWARSGSTISNVMRYIQGTTGRDFNRRKKREGAFWAGRYNPTLIQNGVHLSRCLFYFGMNMVRVGAVSKPIEWECSGYHQISGYATRNSVVNLDRLLKCVHFTGSVAMFHNWYLDTLKEHLETCYLSREPLWTECAAVGDWDWIQGLSNRIVIGKFSINKLSPKGNDTLGEASVSYGLKVSNRERTGIVRDFTI